MEFGPHTDLMTFGGQYADLITLYNNKYDRILKERMKSKTNDDGTFSQELIELSPTLPYVTLININIKYKYLIV